VETFDVLGHFGQYGGRFVPEALIGALEELEAVHNQTQQDPVFLAELAELHRTYTGRPSIILQKLVPVNMELLLRQLRPLWGWNALFIWARKTLAGNLLTLHV